MPELSHLEVYRRELEERALDRQVSGRGSSYCPSCQPEEAP